MTDRTQPEALRLADRLDLYATGDEHQRDTEAAAAELRRQHARIAELEAQLEAIGAGGVSALMGAAKAGSDGVASLPLPGAQEAVAWAMFADNGNIRLWSKKPIPHPDAIPLYAAPQPAVAAGSEQVAEAALRKVLAAVQRYLPPDGPSDKDTLSEIIGIVDPWPLGQLDKS